MLTISNPAGGVLTEYMTIEVKNLSKIISPDNKHKKDTTKGKKVTKKDKTGLNNDKVNKVSTDKTIHKIDTTKGKNITNLDTKKGKKETNNDKKESNNDKVIKVSTDNKLHKIDTTKGTKETNNTNKTGEITTTAQKDKNQKKVTKPKVGKNQDEKITKKAEEIIKKVKNNMYHNNTLGIILKVLEIAPQIYNMYNLI